jgi:hypothetical protein
MGLAEKYQIPHEQKILASAGAGVGVVAAAAAAVVAVAASHSLPPWKART